MVKGSFFFFIVFVFSLSALGQPQLDPLIAKEIQVVKKNGRDVFLISLKGVLHIALNRSPQIKVLQYSTERAKSQWEFARSADPLRLTAQVNQSLNFSPYSFTTVPGTYLSIGATRNNLVSTGLHKKTKWGLQYGLTYQKNISQTQLGKIPNRGAKAEGFVGFTDPVYTDSLLVDVKLPLFQDFGEVNKEPEQRKKIDFDQAQISLKSNREQLLSLVSSTYWDLVAVHHNLQSLDHAVTVAEQSYQDNLTRLKLGGIEESEVKLSQNQLSKVKLTRLSQVMQQKLIEDQIRVALGLSQLDVEYEPTEKLQFKEVDLPQEQLVKQALAADPRLAQFKARLKKNQLDRLKANNHLSTNLDLNFQYQLNGFGYDGSTARSGLSNGGASGYLVALRWEVPLFDRSGAEQLHQVDLEQARLELEYQDMQDQVRLQVGALLRSLTLGQRHIALSQAEVELHQQLLTREQEKFKLGESTSHQVSQVRQDMTEVELALIMAQINYEKSYVALLLFTDQFDDYYDL